MFQQTDLRVHLNQRRQNYSRVDVVHSLRISFVEPAADMGLNQSRGGIGFQLVMLPFNGRFDALEAYPTFKQLNCQILRPLDIGILADQFLVP